MLKEHLQSHQIYGSGDEIFYLLYDGDRNVGRDFYLKKKFLKSRYYSLHSTILISTCIILKT